MTLDMKTHRYRVEIDGRHHAAFSDLRTACDTAVIVAQPGRAVVKRADTDEVWSWTQILRVWAEVK
jgi:hypothetical protein